MRKWIPVMVLGGVLLGASAFWFHSRPYNSSQLLQMLPPDRSAYVYLDVKLLRSAGVLDVIAGSASLEDADYKKFVAETGFDYRTDLDGLAIAFRDGDRYFAAQGNFHWDKLAAYASAHGGKCERFLCTALGSEPGRNVTYYMPRNNILAIATSRTATAGDMVAPGTWQNGPRIPEVGLWVLVPPYALTDLNHAPAIAKPFLTPLAQATSTIFTLGVASSKGGFELRMDVITKDAVGAKKISEQYTEGTGLLVKLMEKEKVQPNPADLSGVLAAGRFEVKDSSVTGRWPISKAFVESLASTVK